MYGTKFGRKTLFNLHIPAKRYIHSAAIQQTTCTIRTKEPFPPRHLVHDITDLPFINSLPHQSDALSSTKFITWPQPITETDVTSTSSIIHSIDHHKPKINVAVSGGVDSGVSTWLLREAGWDVNCVYMRNWDDQDEHGFCNADNEERDAMTLASMLNVSFVKVNFVREYWHHVFEDMLNGYRAGITPNPDVMCNREIKFQTLKQKIVSLTDVDMLATGHYARTQRILCDDNDPIQTDVAQFDEPEISSPQSVTPSLLKEVIRSVSPDVIHNTKSHQFMRLLTARDPVKDQTHFLSLIRGHQLCNVLFPLGALRKSQTRDIAKIAKLNVAQKQDSMGICMIGRRDFAHFLSEYIELTPGEFRTSDGMFIGKHAGTELFTIGQRPHLGGQPHRWYVSAKDRDTGVITLVDHRLHPALLHDSLYLSRMNWISGKPPQELVRQRSMELFCKSRSTELARRCRIEIIDDPHIKARCAEKAKWMHGGTDLDDQHLYRLVMLDVPHSVLSPGQTLALYIRGVCLGGGPLVECGPSYLNQGKFEWKPTAD